MMTFLKRSNCLILFALLLAGCSTREAAPPDRTAPATQEARDAATQTAHQDGPLPYLLYLPAGADKKEGLPLILYLHGKSLRGNNLEMLKQYGLSALLEKQLSIPFIVVSPQCPADKMWVDEEDALLKLIDQVAASHVVDPSRIYVTGHSMGARGTWFLASRHPEKFAAIVPLADGPVDMSWAGKLKNVPIWTFHGTADDLAPFDQTDQFVKELKRVGADVRFTPLPGMDHFILDEYGNKEIYDWLLQHKRVQVTSSEPAGAKVQ
jgi:predicted peptidase